MKEVRSSSGSICCVRPSAVPVGRKTSPNKGIHHAYQGHSSETPPNKGSILSGRQYHSSETPGQGDFHYLRHWSVDFSTTASSCGRRIQRKSVKKSNDLKPSEETEQSPRESKASMFHFEDEQIIHLLLSCIFNLLSSHLEMN